MIKEKRKKMKHTDNNNQSEKIVGEIDLKLPIDVIPVEIIWPGEEINLL